MVAKTYTKVTVDGEQYVLYGEPMTASLYSVAKTLVDSGKASPEELEHLNGIIVTATDESFGNDAGADTGDLWK